MVEKLEDMSVVDRMRELADISKDLNEIMINGNWQTSAFLVDNLPDSINKAILYASLYTQMLCAAEDDSLTPIQKKHLKKLADVYKNKSSCFSEIED
jgi:hypothetical protein